MSSAIEVYNPMSAYNSAINKLEKNRLINGYDDIELTLKSEKLIKEYESNKNKFFDWKYVE